MNGSRSAGDEPAAKRQAKATVTELQRGGVIVHTRIADIQVGIPVETIKESMKLPGGVPTIFIAPREMWDFTRGITLCEFEFPAYFNFFIKKRHTKFVCTREQETRIRAAFYETLIGPEDDQTEREYVSGHLVGARPNFRREGDYFRRVPGSDKLLDIDTLVSFVTFDDNNVAVLDDGISVIWKDKSFDIMDGDALVHSADAVFQLPPLTELPTREVFEPPLFGVTILGNSHGFDPNARTTGMVIWVNKKGILVDPPIFSADILRSYGITPPMITHLIVTHCHGDHDSGAFQKILEDTKITVITTNTVIGSFVRKYAALSGMSEPQLRRLFTFQPAIMGQGLRVHGADLHFRYNFHPIPCIGVEVYFAGESLVYSSDTFNSPEVVSKLAEDGLMTQARADFLNNFPWHHSVVIHEAGVPPIHTPMATFEALSQHIRDKLYLVHCSDASVPEGTGLRKAKDGAENTIVIDVKNPARAEALEILDCLETIDIFHGLDIRQCRDVLGFARIEEYNEGENIITEGDDTALAFYVVLSGCVKVFVGKDRQCNACMYSGDFFGEMALLENRPRSASVVAQTSTRVLVFHKREFLHMIRDLKLIDRLRHLADIRRSEFYQVIQQNRHLKKVTARLITALQQVLEQKTYTKGTVIFKSGDAPSSMLTAVLVIKGAFKYEGCDDELGTGAFVGDFDSMLDDQPCRATLVAAQETRAFHITRENLVRLTNEFPGFALCLRSQLYIE